MADVDSVRLQMNDTEVRKSSVRQTPLTSFGETFQRGLQTGVNTVGNAVSSAGYVIPGAAVVGAAISSAGAVRSTSSGLSSVSPGATGLVASTGSAGAGIGSVGTTSTLAGSTAGMSSGSLAASGNYTGAVAANAAGGDASSQLMMATQQMQEMNQNFNLQYLQLQEHMQQDSREFTAMSNVIKTKSDTAKNSLSNLK